MFRIKAQICPLTRFIKHYMFFLSLVPQSRPGMLYRLLLWEYFAHFYIYDFLYHQINLTFNIGLEDLRKIKVSYQIIVYINELIKIVFS